MIWLHMAPVDDMMVVSEIGEQWSPNTAPARQADMLIISSSGVWLALLKTPTTRGRSIPKVPQEVPVAKDIPAATINTIAGKNIVAVLSWKIPLTNSPAPRRLVSPLRVQAKVRMSMAGTMALNPLGRHSMHSLKESTLRARNK